MSYLLNLIEKQDLFAVPLAFSFNGKSGERGTWGGGCLSILMKVAVMAYTVKLTSKMLNREDFLSESFDVKGDFFNEVALGDAKVKV